MGWLRVFRNRKAGRKSEEVYVWSYYVVSIYLAACLWSVESNNYYCMVYFSSALSSLYIVSEREFPMMSHVIIERRQGLRTIALALQAVGDIGSFAGQAVYQQQVSK